MNEHPVDLADNDLPSDASDVDRWKIL